MRTIFKYRPHSDFLFKELYYNELYFASYEELNDPLDLSARIDFTPYEINSLDYLIWFIMKVHVDLSGKTSTIEVTNLFIKLHKNDEAIQELKESIFEKMEAHLVSNKNIWLENLITILRASFSEVVPEVKMDEVRLKSKLEQLSRKFLRASFVSCFSEKNNEPLMWAHYASKHAGVCLEFNLETLGMFTYEVNHDFKTLAKDGNIIKEFTKETYTYKDRIRSVSYEAEQPHVNFFKFAPVFENENDTDLIELNKSWTHDYAHELEWVFSTKTLNWEYEKELRAIQINFKENQIPEERIRHYPIEMLKSVYFGSNTPEVSKKRIYKIISRKSHEIQFFNTQLGGANKIIFEDYEP
ncbi:DUF2971 domain-containing protein [Ancylomarina euxinus]|nr:DUF2971 domain-containing protein [Ancylomarina euxinus]MCZ4696407.1 DUF2971 domain-containing protein [Ancylomarina euxinus]